jgi:hypothetical protein
MQGSFVQMALADLEKALADPENVEADRAWKSIQDILLGAANLSKLLWGSFSSGQKRKRAAERAEIRTKLDVDDSSPLYDMTMRNHFEHFDERLEDEMPVNKFRIRYVGSPEDAKRDGYRVFQQFDPATGIVRFWDHSVELEPLLIEIARIKENALAAMGIGMNWTYIPPGENWIVLPSGVIFPGVQP